MYKCGKCGKIVEIKREDPRRCPFCGHKILFKERPKVIQKVKAI